MEWAEKIMRIETQGLTKAYEGKEVLKDINLTVQDAEFFAVVGPSGSGKTTLLRLLDLLERPSRGRIIFNGIEVGDSERDRHALRRRIGMVFQQTALLNLSVYDNVAYPLKIRNQPRDMVHRRVQETLELVGLKGFEKRKATTLSGGEMQRVALAQAIIYEPELLLLDEPTVNLDPRNVAIIENVISHVNKELKMTVIMATHNMLQAEQLADRVAILREGELAGIGHVEEIFGKPSDFLASFARLNNVFSGISHIGENGVTKIDIDGLELEATITRTGKVTIFIRPEDIILSTSPIVSSARNTFKGKIIEATDLNRNVQVKVDAGKVFVATITRRSFQEMRLNLGSEVYLTFKASAVHAV